MTAVPRAAFLLYFFLALPTALRVQVPLVDFSREAKEAQTFEPKTEGVPELFQGVTSPPAGHHRPGGSLGSLGNGSVFEAQTPVSRRAE